MAKRRETCSMLATNEPKLLTFAQAGALMSVSRDTVRRLVRAGKLRAVYPSARPRIPTSEIDRYIRELCAPNVLQFSPKPAAKDRLSRRDAAKLLR
jgi:excisionase family DNA binding protein